VHVPELEVEPESQETVDDAVTADDEVVVEAVAAVEDFAGSSAASETEFAAGPDYPAAAIAPVAASDLPSDELLPAEDDEEEDDQVLPRSKRAGEEMDMTPMVDVTFLLLIFFMVTAAFSLQKSIVMPRQQTDAPSTSVVEEQSEDLDMVEVQVDEFGSYLVMAPDWERETPGKQNLIRALKEAIAGHNDGMRLAIKVHERAELHALVDAMDAGTISGYAELEVTQVEEFD
jgi:biopolymer transport protein ExbD